MFSRICGLLWVLQLPVCFSELLDRSRQNVSPTAKVFPFCQRCEALWRDAELCLQKSQWGPARWQSMFIICTTIYRYLIYWYLIYIYLPCLQYIFYLFHYMSILSIHQSHLSEQIWVYLSSIVCLFVSLCCLIGIASIVFFYHSYLSLVYVSQNHQRKGPHWNHTGTQFSWPEPRNLRLTFQ